MPILESTQNLMAATSLREEAPCLAPGSVPISASYTRWNVALCICLSALSHCFVLGRRSDSTAAVDYCYGACLRLSAAYVCCIALSRFIVCVFLCQDVHLIISRGSLAFSAVVLHCLILLIHYPLFSMLAVC